jgi:hypothetical protein
VSFTVSRDDSPGAFWLLAGFNACVVLVVAYVVYVAAGLTYQALLAGQWDWRTRLPRRATLSTKGWR